MAKVLIPNAAGSDAPGDAVVVDLKQPWLGGLLAWAIPGMGHIYQGRTGKGVLFFVCILGTFAYGMYLGEGKVVYAATNWEQQYRWQYLCQLGVGLPATPMLIQRERAKEGKPPLWGGFMAQPKNMPTDWKDDSGNISRQPNELSLWTVKMHPRFELGTVFTVIAGLLNVLVICDAVSGPLIIKAHSKKRPATDDEPTTS